MYLRKLQWLTTSLAILLVVLVPMGAVARSVSYRSGQVIVLLSVLTALALGYLLTYELDVW
ncbi:hypothetical protein NKF06_00665 [Haloferax sp. AB510]|uniref:hypothetical protein n=1 Tax=Haloferax sp. AB510 TaxID=2934172 RepID=UPI00209C304F|nr:hypothetical protein [Haloferax sp. AB510]MCO8265133.1 hypothetical protein [Haloferax sp. AB510]